MARRNVRLDHGGMADLARSPKIRAEITRRAEQVAALVRAQNIHVEGEPGDVSLPVEVTSYTTDRARSSVTIKHPAGQAVQGKRGALTKAAAQAGLDLGGASVLLDYVTKSGKKRKATQAQIDAWTRGR